MAWAAVGLGLCRGLGWLIRWLGVVVGFALPRSAWGGGFALGLGLCRGSPLVGLGLCAGGFGFLLGLWWLTIDSWWWSRWVLVALG